VKEKAQERKHFSITKRQEVRKKLLSATEITQAFFFIIVQQCRNNGSRKSEQPNYKR
jgi:hypothetical protein